MHFNVLKNLSSLEIVMQPRHLHTTLAAAHLYLSRNQECKADKWRLSLCSVSTTGCQWGSKGILEQEPMTLQAFALAASNGRTTPRNLSFIALLNSFSLHLIRMSPDLWPPFYVATFFKQAVKIELSDFYLSPNPENWVKSLKKKF